MPDSSPRRSTHRVLRTHQRVPHRRLNHRPWPSNMQANPASTRPSPRPNPRSQPDGEPKTPTDAFLTPTPVGTTGATSSSPAMARSSVSERMCVRTCDLRVLGKKRSDTIRRKWKRIRQTPRCRHEHRTRRWRAASQMTGRYDAAPAALSRSRCVWPHRSVRRMSFISRYRCMPSVGDASNSGTRCK